MGRGRKLRERRRGGGARTPLRAVPFLCLSFVVASFFRGRRVEEEEHPTMTAPADRGQERVKNVLKKPPLSARGSGKAAAMALRAPCNGI